MWDLWKLTSFHGKRYKMELTSKTRKQFVFVNTYRCYYMSIVILIFYMGI